jgi:hypothetical protein
MFHTSTHKHKDRSVVLRSFVPLFLVCSFVRPIVHGSFVRLSDHSFVHPNNLFPAVMLPKFRSFVRPIIRSFVRSFIVPIHRSSFGHMTIHRYYSSSLLFIDTIHRCYCLFYYSSIIRSPQISTTHPSCCPVHLRPARPIFQSYELR